MPADPKMIVQCCNNTAGCKQRGRFFRSALKVVANSHRFIPPIKCPTCGAQRVTLRGEACRVQGCLKVAEPGESDCSVHMRSRPLHKSRCENNGNKWCAADMQTLADEYHADKGKWADVYLCGPLAFDELATAIFGPSASRRQNFMFAGGIVTWFDGAGWQPRKIVAMSHRDAAQITGTPVAHGTSSAPQQTIHGIPVVVDPNVKDAVLVQGTLGFDEIGSFDVDTAPASGKISCDCGADSVPGCTHAKWCSTGKAFS